MTLKERVLNGLRNTSRDLCIGCFCSVSPDKCTFSIDELIEEVEKETAVGLDYMDMQQSFYEWLDGGGLEKLSK